MDTDGFGCPNALLQLFFHISACHCREGGNPNALHRLPADIETIGHHAMPAPTHNTPPIVILSRFSTPAPNKALQPFWSGKAHEMAGAQDDNLGLFGC
jgi:hypothetical protein